MDNKIAKVALAMMQKNSGDTKRIEHSLKVFAYAQLLGIAESLDENTLEILELTALLHDIGIHVAERKYGKSTSLYQESEGPPVAHEILSSFGFGQETIRRVCFIISKHHTFTAIDGVDFQLLVEADFLVNSSEDHMSDDQIVHFAKNIFKSESGTMYLRLLFPNIEL
ncbi:MAG TPA: HD domain-containing protein [Prolixibacteraceae bacterium]|jgi:HD superfamily phosphodiesterase